MRLRTANRMAATAASSSPTCLQQHRRLLGIDFAVIGQVFAGPVKNIAVAFRVKRVNATCIAHIRISPRHFRLS